uniref:Putative FMN-linked oxidoreductase n=1 Tax=Moniliophthora roreri TaxID=221103 RepID=A0A0W0FI95_MONRR
MSPFDLNLTHITAPMVNQSDLPFRTLTFQHGATLAYTQMLHPSKLLNDQDYLAFHRQDLSIRDRFGAEKTVVQLCGNDPEEIVRAARTVVDLCDGIGCPQEHARDGHYGAYLIGPSQKDWPLIESMVSTLSHSLHVPVSAKLRLCNPPSSTPELALRTQNAGAAFVALHARTVSAKRRRHGPADLDEVKRLKEDERITIPVVSNGNVMTYEDIEKNLEYTGADGAMVGETVLENPYVFSNASLPDPLEISLEYIDLCRLYPDTATLTTIKTHIRHFYNNQCSRQSWYTKFRMTLNNDKEYGSLDEVERFLRGRVERWRGRPHRGDSAEEEDEHKHEEVDFEGIPFGF